jgi:hypothetical protein
MAIPTGFIFADQGLLHLNDWLALYFALVRWLLVESSAKSVLVENLRSYDFDVEARNVDL